MKMLFSPSDSSAARQVRNKLSRAGIACALNQAPHVKGVFGIEAAPELLIENERDIIKAFKLLGSRRLRQMTVIL
jgi:hypothetical protein